MPAFSVLILTLNEEANLPGVLASARAASDDVAVLDSGSTDRTVALAETGGARVFANRFENFAQQRNHAHDAIPFRHPWVFHLDADERMTPALAAECAGRPDDPALDGCYAAPRMLLRGRWIPRSTDWPAWQARFVHARRFRFVEVGHGQREAPGMRLGQLRYGYDHEIFSTGGVEGWLEKHRGYARREAAELLATDRPATALLREVVRGEPLARRRALKALSRRVPLRPLARFAYQWGLRGGWRDGRAGWEYCRLLARYEGFVRDELRRPTKA